MQAVYKVVENDPRQEELDGVVHVLEVDGHTIPNYLAVRLKAPQPLERASSDIWRVPSQYGSNPNVPDDVPYWADLPWKQRVKFHYKDVTQVRFARLPDPAASLFGRAISYVPCPPWCSPEVEPCFLLSSGLQAQSLASLCAMGDPKARSAMLAAGQLPLGL